MSRVLKEIPIKEKQVVCPHCGRTIAYVNNDINEQYYKDYGGGGDTSYWVVCPGDGCGKNITVKSSYL